MNGGTGPIIPDDLVEVLGEVIGLCCMGVAVYGPERCTCWVPLFDLEQSDVDESTANDPGARTKCCHDCAYRNGSPERSDDREEWLLELPSRRDNIFWCHQGLRRVVSWSHPCGLTIPAGVGDYQPPIVGGRPIRADGSYGEICAGWLALRLSSEYRVA
jgi:hypothetical protein